MDKRIEYVKKLSAQMVELEVQIDALKGKAASATVERSLYARTTQPCS